MEIEKANVSAERHPSLDGLADLVYRNSSLRDYLVKMAAEDGVLDSMDSRPYEIREREVIEREREFTRWKEQNSLISEEISHTKWHEHVGLNSRIANLVSEIAFDHQFFTLRQLGSLSDDEILGRFNVGESIVASIRQKCPYSPESTS